MKHVKKWATSAACLAALGFIAVGCGTTQSSPPGGGGGAATTNTTSSTPAGNLMTVKVAMDEPSPSMAGIVLADKLGYFKQQGIQIQATSFASGADAMTGLAANQVDVAPGLISAYVFNAVQSGLNIKIVADEGRDQPTKGYFEFVLRKSLASKITNYSQLKGLTLGIASRGNINELMLDKVLAKGGLTEKDVHIKVVDDFADFNTALANGAMDGAMQIEPFITLGEQKNIAVPFKTPGAYAPNEEISVIMYSPQFASNKQLATRWMTAYLEGVRAFDNAMVYGNQNRQQVAEIMAAYTKTSVSQFEAMNMPLLDPNGYVDPAAVQSDETWYAGQGTVKTPVAVNKVLDPQFAQAAVAKLGSYQKP